MNIITYIQTALTALGSSATVMLSEKSRAENEELEHEGAVVVVFPDWQTTTQITGGAEMLKVRTYNLVFKTLDEWDNSDNDSAIYGSSSVEIIESMEQLADSVFAFISFNMSQFPELRKKLEWKTPTPILREGNGTMSGVRVQLTVTFTGTRLCPPTA